MTFDFSKFRAPARGTGEIDPIKLFRSLQMRDQAVNDLWMGQADALRQWHDSRKQEDLAIVLNTGAGKTLVGVLVAQSLVNEMRAHVVYVCASIQLVQQTATKAQAYGLPVTTYYEGDFSDDQYHSCQGPCITTYQALFNGLVRKWNDVSAIVFDDAHAATHIIRDQFTLTLDSVQHTNAYNVIVRTFGQYLRETGSDIGFRQALERKDPSNRWLVPPFVVKHNLGDISNALMEAHLDRDRVQKFAWGYLHDKIDLCAVFLTPSTAAFTPPVVPVRALPYFRKGVRRVYLSATLAAKDAFLRTFGKIPDVTIAPETPAGQCERMILIPRKTKGVSDEVFETKQALNALKALLLVPSAREGAAWDDVVAPGLGDAVPEQVENFKQAPAPTKLRLVARYDGVDLPGDTCRAMVIHGLPSGLGPLERFMWESLRIHTVLRSTVASRVVQSFGRISRGMADHGVVFLSGQHLLDWLRVPANLLALPGFLRRQIELGFELSEQLESRQLADVAQRCLQRDPEWLGFYAQQLGLTTNETGEINPALAEAAAVEAAFGLHLWHREYEAACSELYRGRDKFFDVGTGLGAWYRLWEGYLHEFLGHPDEALALYEQARAADKTIPSATSLVPGEAPQPSEDSLQLDQVARNIRSDSKLLRLLDQDTAALESGASVPQTEEAVRRLGMHLGLNSSRPDKDQGTGPDVLWHLDGRAAWAMELKTGKEEAVTYSKKNVMQAVDHVQWVLDNHDVATVTPMLVGPRRPPDARANPPENLVVVEVAALREIRDRLRAAIVNIGAHMLPVTVRAEVQKQLKSHGLLWSQLSAAAPGVALRTLHR
jgi:tetratricopeptide (TPR) repeat protein